MRKLSNNYKLILDLVLILTGVGFLIWGSIIEYYYPGAKEARIVIRNAFYSAWIQLGIGFGILIYYYISLKHKS